MTDAERPAAPPADAPRSPPSRWIGEPASGTRFGRAALVLAPLALVGLAWWLVGVFVSRPIANEALAAGGVFLTFVGPSVIFGPAIVGTNVFENLTTWDLVAVTAFFTCATAFLYSYNIDLLERLPGIGPRMRTARASMEHTLRARPWIRRFALLGVGFFVLLPLPGSGSLGGSILGRLIGLSRLGAFAAVSVGGGLVCLAYGAFGETFRRFGEANRLSTPVKIAGAAAFLLVLVVIGRLVGRRLRAASGDTAAGAS